MTRVGDEEPTGHARTDADVVVVIPTYNEALTLERTVSRLRTAVPTAHILIVDDGSPDGTGELADKMAARDSRIEVLHRAGKQGLGRAYVAGFGWALDRGFGYLVEMDADGSHQPEELPSLLAAAGNADLVLGSRYVPGGSVVNWPRRREVLSRGANTYTRFMLGLGVHDATSGFRVFSASALRTIDLASVASQGYCFQIDLAWRAVCAGLRVVEVPITFVEREQGESKMGTGIVKEAFLQVTRWGAGHRLRQVRSAVRAPAFRGNADES
ncbi:polyprenol monophosphomannose synthase [Phytoactinopolyspora halotolerans]|uniref:Polyprenol monophosphomannose synthase n=1 Tax=Phytoactinopolyspora halotolerans TaxID=1981512 RepID=A0A6L9S9L6_9ACTN|nr:polyprenol monophosphomannose synthase [Phytoactinopolyspora halotolerans]NEE01391.1 polyprenol monophosphomannose synthase [Phytoactinopolyspora halotolerans]